MLYDKRCSNCTCEFRVVPGDGPISRQSNPHKILFIGTRPGQHDKERMFMGHSGMEFNGPLLELAGLSRDQIRITNTVKCWAVANRKPNPAEIESCTTTYLEREVAEMDPDVVVLMGGSALSLTPDLDLETHHGIPQRTKVFGVLRDVFVTYHPAIGLQDTRKIRQLRDDFRSLGMFLRGEEGSLITDPHAGKERYVEARRNGTSLLRPSVRLGLGVDTEEVAGKLWSAQLSNVPGTGTMFWADEHEDMAYVQKRLHEDAELYIHNSTYDVEELYKFERLEKIVGRLYEYGFTVDWSKVRDTMMSAYHRDMPQGLKPLAYRLCGMTMQGYEDLVMPYSREVVIEWILKAIDLVPRMVSHHLKNGDTRYKNHPLATELNRILGSTLKGGGYSPWKRWREFTAKTDDKSTVAVDAAMEIVAKIGTMPIAGLDRVPLDKAIFYSCRDPDAGWRVERAIQEYDEMIGTRELEVSTRDWDR